MSSITKIKLKVARDALGKKDYEGAHAAASQILDYEPENYNANVFLGLSLLELGDHDKSEQAYKKAIDSQPEQLLAWQGISKFYERTKNWEKYADTLLHLMDHFSRNNDTTKTAETLQKYLKFRRECGSRAQLTQALYLLLPESHLYPILSTLPPPDLTNPTSTTTSVIESTIHNSLPVIEEIVLLTETAEEEIFKKEFDRRRTRLGVSGPEELKKEIGREVWGPSKLPQLYDEILNHPNTADDLRRQTESKLLRYKQRYLHVLPTTGELFSVKVRVSREVDALVNGAVTLGILDDLAWLIYIEGKDCDTIDGYDFASLRQFIRLFPLLPMTKLLKGYFTFIGAPLPRDEEDDDAGDTFVTPTEDEAFDIVMDAFTLLPGSIIAHRIMANLYLKETDYQNAIRIAETGIELVGKMEVDNAKQLFQVKKAFNVVLATSLVHYFPPKHHICALGIIDEVLTLDPDNVPCLMGRAYILEASERWDDAAKLFEKVAQTLPEDVGDVLRAKEEQAWCQLQVHESDTAISGLKLVLEVLEGSEDRDEDKARCLWRIGKCYWEAGETQHNEAFQYFITALKRNSTYAPAFTSLGIYYAESLTPPDLIRASKCFQKAFELDARETYAAHRLAEGFAEEREWDLVEVVARRTIDGEGGLEAGLKDGSVSVSGRYLPTNAWAWKAVGVVELTRRNYPPAIEAFQIALRAEPDDQLSWLRLGEAYSRAGRHAAAVKALTRAHELAPDDWICTFFIGEVHSQTGRFPEAIQAFESILVGRPSEIGVLLSLAQTYLERGRDELSSGFLTRAEQTFESCIAVSLRLIRETETSGFRSMAWKIVGDAIFCLSKQFLFTNAASMGQILSEVASLITSNTSDRLSGILATPKPNTTESPAGGFQALEIAIAVYDYRLLLGASDNLLGSPWYDLGSALYSWSTRTLSQDKEELAIKQAISFFTKALREEPGNDKYWNALGSVNCIDQPKTAQHAFIKALEIDDMNVVTWTNLGLLYLYHEDLQLANEALYRAQTLDPDYPVTWVGQGLVATANGRDKDARAMFEHVVGLAADMPEANLEYAFRVFSGLSHTTYGHPAPYDALFPTFFVLDRYSKQRPDDASGLHLFGLVCERLGHIDLGIELVQRAIGMLEGIYEETEDPIVERQFMIANSSLARLKLSAQDYDGAIESFESTLGLLPEEIASAENIILRAHCQFGSGLAQFKLGNLGEALSLFKAAQESAEDNVSVRGQVTILLAQTMWAIGIDEFKECAKSQLLECITTDPENLTAINALAGMGILTDDDSLIDAALSEILALPLERRHELDPLRGVDYFLIQHHLGQGDVVQAQSVAQKAIHAEPSRPAAKRALAALSVQDGQPAAAVAILGSQHEEDRESLGLRAIAESMVGGIQKDRMVTRRAQKAVVLAPWEIRNWQTLAYVWMKSEDWLKWKQMKN